MIWTVAVPHSKEARTFALPVLKEPGVTSAAPPDVVFEIVGRPFSLKKPKSVMKVTDVPSGTACPSFFTVARITTAVPPSVSIGPGGSVSATPQPGGTGVGTVLGAVGDSPEQPESSRASPAADAAKGLRIRRMVFTSSASQGAGDRFQTSGAPAQWAREISIRPAAAQ